MNHPIFAVVAVAVVVIVIIAVVDITVVVAFIVVGSDVDIVEVSLRNVAVDFDERSASCLRFIRIFQIRKRNTVV